MSEPEWYQVVGWDKHQNVMSNGQHGPWLKVQRKLLQDVKYLSMTRECRSWLLDLWILAANERGQVANQPKLLQTVTASETPPPLEELVEAGWLKPIPKAIPNGVPNGVQTGNGIHFSLGEERRGEKKREEEIDTGAAFDLVPKSHHDLLKTVAGKYEDPDAWMVTFEAVITGPGQNLERLDDKQRASVVVDTLAAINAKGGKWPPDQRWWKQVALNAADKVWRERASANTDGGRIGDGSAARYAR